MARKRRNLLKSRISKMNQKEDDKSLLYEKRIFDLQQLLEISMSFCSTIEFLPLIESISYVVMAQMHASEASIFIKGSLNSDYFKLVENHSVDSAIEYKISESSKLIEFFSSAPRPFKVPELKQLLPACEDVGILEDLHPSLVVPIVIKNRVNGIILIGERIQLEDTNTDYTSYELDEIQVIASLAAVAINNASLIELTSTDMMTKLKQKFYFYSILENKLDSSFSQNKKLSVIMFDIDFFKKVNDTYGHACGDCVLIKVAEIIRNSIREYDFASRYGGEEFTLMLCDSGKEEALFVTERIRKRIEDTFVSYECNNIHVTISAGISVFSVDENPVRNAKTLVEQADKALYVSKQTGRNKISVYEVQKENSNADASLSSENTAS